MIIAILLVAFALPAWSLTNLLPNPSMGDADGDGVADEWDPNIHEADGAEGELAIDTEIARSGGTSQRIEHTSDNAAWIRISQDGLKARPEATYRVEAWVRATGAWTVILYEFAGEGEEYITNTVGQGAATDGWQRVSGTVTTQQTTNALKLSLISNGPGTVWFDDAALVMIAERPSLRVPMVDAAPRIDGDLADAAWESAGVAGDFMVLGGEGERAEVGTRALVCFDAEAVYIAFECQEPNIEALVTDAQEDSSAVWGDDCVEAFLDTEHERSGYVHLGVSASGAKWQERRMEARFYTTWYGTGTGGEVPMPQWTAAARVDDGAWFAELRLPFSEVGGRPSPGVTWGASFCRTRRATGEEQNSTWSYTPGEFYAVPERFGTLAFAGGRAKAPVEVSRHRDYRPPKPTVIPQPQSLTWREGAFRPDTDTVIAPVSEEHEMAARMLQADVHERFLLPLAIEAGGRPGPNTIAIRVAKGGDLPPEGYRLTVTGQGIDVAGADVRGAFHGVQTLRQMLTRDARGPMVYACEVRDWPDTGWRAWHVAGPRAPELDIYREFIDFLALLKYNTICLEVNDKLQYESHPEIARDDAPSKQQLRELVEYARERHFRIFPQLATFAHFGYVLRHEEWRHLAEAQETTLGHRSLFNYCPSHPETYPLVFDLMDELIDVFGSDYFHIGHDEATFDDIGTCPRCRDQDPAELFVGDIVKLHDHLAERGIRTLMWGDMFLPSHNGMKYGTAAVTDELRETAARSQDILICDWHYSPTHDFDETLSYWEEHGFEALGCPWYHPLNVWGFARAVHEHEAVGMLGTTWSAVGTDVHGLPHVPVGWVLGAENCWSVGAPEIDRLGYHPIPAFNRLWRLNQHPQPRRFMLVDIAPFCNESTIDTQRKPGWMRLGPEYDLRALPTGRTWIGDTPFQLVDPAANEGRSCVMLADAETPTDAYPVSVWEIPVGTRARGVRFLHTTSVPDQRVSHIYDRQRNRPGRVGHYTICYADGSEVTAELRFEANISDWNSQRGPVRAVDLWQGHTQAGALATLAVWEWENPKPDLEIASISMTSAEAEVQPVLLGVTLVP
ncbi:MAG: glycoside hydrolase family 20 zincin-like fold domain-containing protein [Armatimonadota bacterium]|nr:glycoside hydrolase family 20 zincin-like fold domain-containing protein [Armatimonadota bacterium]